MGTYDALRHLPCCLRRLTLSLPVPVCTVEGLEHGITGIDPGNVVCLGLGGKIRPPPVRTALSYLSLIFVCKAPTRNPGNGVVCSVSSVVLRHPFPTSSVCDPVVGTADPTDQLPSPGDMV